MVAVDIPMLAINYKLENLQHSNTVPVQFITIETSVNRFNSTTPLINNPDLAYNIILFVQRPLQNVKYWYFLFHVNSL